MESEEFSTSRVPQDRSVTWWKIAMINVLFSFSLPSLIAGMDLANGTTSFNLAWGILAGSAILTVIAMFTSVVGSRTRLSSYMLARIAFGTHGSMILNLAFAISLVGWFGVNLNLFGQALARLLPALIGYRGPEWPIELVAGALITGTTMIGLKAINVLSYLIVPVLIFVCGLLLVRTVGYGTIDEILARAPGTGLTFGDTVSAVVGGVIVGAVIMPDTCRFIGPTRGAVWTAVLTYFVTNGAVMMIGGLAALALRRTDMLDLMLAMGLGTAAFAVVIGSSWLLNALNLYSAALSVGASVPRLSRSTTTLTCGLLGTLSAFLEILNHFLTFLFYLSIVFVPVASVILIDCLFLRPATYIGPGELPVRAIEPAALLSWAVGAAFAVLGSMDLMRLTGIAALDAMFITGTLYAALRWRVRASRAATAS
jgi:cytosine permease